MKIIKNVILILLILYLLFSAVYTFRCIDFGELTEMVGMVTTLSVTYAVRDTHIDDFDVSVGEIIGLDNSSILAKGKEIPETVDGLVAKLIDEDTVNVTLFYGQEVTEEDAIKR